MDKYGFNLFMNIFICFIFFFVLDVLVFFLLFKVVNVVVLGVLLLIFLIFILKGNVKLGFKYDLFLILVFLFGVLMNIEVGGGLLILEEGMCNKDMYVELRVYVFRMLGFKVVLFINWNL